MCLAMKRQGFNLYAFDDSDERTHKIGVRQFSTIRNYSNYTCFVDFGHLSTQLVAVWSQILYNQCCYITYSASFALGGARMQKMHG